MNNIYIDLGKKLTEQQIREVAKKYDVPYASLKAVILTEARSDGFYSHTLIPVVRFENHIFHKKTNGIYAKSHPTLSSKTFTNKYNKQGYNEYLRFLQAYDIDSDSAIWSTSWGIGQVMGFNFAVTGAMNLHQFMNNMFDSESKQIEAMMGFIKANGLLQAMRNSDWSTFARGYNGKDYALNKYHTKLASAYKQYA